MSSSLRRNSLVDAAVERIRAMIEQEGWTAGSRLSTEAALVEQLDVSRTVVREAIRRLETIGLVQVRHGRGMFVGDPDSLAACVQLVRTALAISPRELIEFTELRSAMEVYAARKASQMAGENQLAELESLCERTDREQQNDEDAIRADFAFHQKLIEISGNQVMLNVMKVLQEFFLAAMATAPGKPGDRKVSRHLHQPILEAIRLRSPDAAEKAMQAHMEIDRARLAASGPARLSSRTASTAPTRGSRGGTPREAR